MARRYDTAFAPRARNAPGQGAGGLIRFLLLLALFAIALRSFVFAPFSIPSESMLPRLMVGDYLFVAKWPYGWSRYSLPFDFPLFEGRIMGRMPSPGDVVVFKAPPDQGQDYIKRVIALPGDVVALEGGTVIVNGKPIPRTRIADILVPISPNTHCPAPASGSAREETLAGDHRVCRYARYRETLPDGRSYVVIDQGEFPMPDYMPPRRVPADHLFLMGDNRDASADSRFSAEAGHGIGMVPVDNLVGRAMVGFFSTDGSADLAKPWTWIPATRWSRIGEGF